jgi:hypothetical protein
VTGEHPRDAPNTETSQGRGVREPVTSLGTAPTDRRTRLLVGASLGALAAVGLQTTVRLFANLPFDPTVVSPAVRAAVTQGTPLVVAGALVAVALTDDRPTVRVGLLFAAVFGPLGFFVPAATLPATVAVAGGGALALLGGLGIPDTRTYRSLRRRAIAVGLVAGVAVSLAAGAGLLGGGHGVGSALALASVAAVGTRAERSRVAAGCGVLAAAFVVYASATSPYVVGSAMLVVLAVTGVPHVLVALAVAGGVAAAVAGLGRKSYPLAIGAGLLVLAGVPVALPRAMIVLLGGALVLLAWHPTGEVRP